MEWQDIHPARSAGNVHLPEALAFEADWSVNWLVAEKQTFELADIDWS